MLLFLKILGGVLALGMGIYWGLSGEYRPDPEEIDRALEGGRRSRRAKRHFTPLGWLRKNEERSSRARRRTRGASTTRFNLSAPDAGEKK